MSKPGADTKIMKMRMIASAFLRKHLVGFLFFYRFLRGRIAVVILVSIFIGVLDGLGLSMFLPLLHVFDGNQGDTESGLGNLAFIVKGWEMIGVPLTLRVILMTLVVFFVVKGFVSYYGNVYQVKIRQYFLRTVRTTLLDDLNTTPLEKFNRIDIGRVQNVFTTETERITTAFVHYFRALTLAIHLVVYVVFAIIVNPQFAILVVIGGALSQVVFGGLFKRSLISSRNLSTGTSEFHRMVTEHITNFKYLKATNGHLSFGQMLKNQIVKIEAENWKLGVYGAIMAAGREPLLIIIVAAVILIQTEVFGGALAPILVSLLFFYRALTSLSTMQSTWNLFTRFRGSLENVQDFLGLLKAGREKDDGVEKFPGVKSGIKLSNISFGIDGVKILEDITLHIHAKESIALIGPSGSGKTTLVNVIARLYEPTIGTYTIDDREVNEFSRTSFHRKIGFVAQEPVMFAASIFDNVTLWAARDEHALEKFHRVLRLTSLEQLVQTLEKKEDTMIGHNGLGLSGGQRQRIAIARELFRDIDLLILDEPTSALDSETESVIQESLEALKGQYTVIFITHRISTIKNVDRIALLENGRLLKILPFDALLTSEPRFKRMIELQSFNS